jgi:predicted DNA-binding transcriptional regulator YafY
MSRTHRLLSLLQELRARRRPVTAEALAASLGISVRTLYRDINLLRSQGAYIDGEAGFGYVLKPGFMLPPLMFTVDEIDVIMLGASWVSQRKDLAMETSARSAIAKIAAVLPPEMTRAMDASGLLLNLVNEGAATSIDAAAIRDALRRERKLTIAYVDAADTASERIVWPVAIAVCDNTQILAAWCELRADYRHFRLDRIRHVTVQEARMPRRRAAMRKEWREREKACIPEGVMERDAAHPDAGPRALGGPRGDDFGLKKLRSS